MVIHIVDIIFSCHLVGTHKNNQKISNFNEGNHSDEDLHNIQMIIVKKRSFHSDTSKAKISLRHIKTEFILSIVNMHSVVYLINFTNCSSLNMLSTKHATTRNQNVVILSQMNQNEYISFLTKLYQRRPQKELRGKFQ